MLTEIGIKFVKNFNRKRYKSGRNRQKFDQKRQKSTLLAPVKINKQDPISVGAESPLEITVNQEQDE